MVDDVKAFDPVERVNDAKFDAEIEKLIVFAEDMRIDLMRKHRTRNNIAFTSFIIFILIGSAAFGWFLFFKGRIDLAIVCVLLSIVLPFLLHLWAEKPLDEYKTQYKKRFMPKLAQLLGGLKFYPSRGIGSKILSKTGVLPKFENYKAEDCFMGVYKGVKVIFSEARLYKSAKDGQPIFDGIFVLLEAPRAVFDAHTILTNDHNMVQRYAGKRWQKLEPVGIPNPPEGAEMFKAYSSSPESAQLLIGDKLLKEVNEASLIFNKAPVTSVFFRKKYIFMMIPQAHDMFEASSIHIPVQTRQHAQQCRHEINQILEIVDVFDIFKDAPGLNEAVTPTPDPQQEPQS